MKIPIPANEAKRLEALRRFRILDTPSEPDFDDLAQLAAFICETPIALISLVDADRQWFKARVGLDTPETSRELAFCSYTILGDEPMMVEDTTVDDRFSGNPLVTSDPHIRFYAGAPLIDREGNALGSLCVIDRKVRTLTPEQIKAMQALSRQVITQLELRRTTAELAESLADLKTLHGLLPICAHCKGIRNDGGYWQSVEAYVAAHSDADFTHGICPPCMEKHYPELFGNGQKTAK